MTDSLPVEKSSGHGHVLYVQNIGSIRKHRIDSESSDVWNVRDGIGRKEKFINVYYFTILGVHSRHTLVYIIESVSRLPFELGEYYRDPQQKNLNNNRLYNRIHN